MRKITLLLLAFTVLYACDNDKSKKKKPVEVTSPQPEKDINDTDSPTQLEIDADEDVVESANTIESELIDGPANVRAAIDSEEVLFSLNDGVPVTCEPLENDWYRIGIVVTVKSNLDAENVPAGTKLMVKGKEVGVAENDTPIEYKGGSKENTWAVITGYTHKNNIKKYTIIENALEEYMKGHNNDRNLKTIEPFITKFAMEKDTQFDGYTMYTVYENWLDDPSPSYRIGLTFKDEVLVAVWHDRPLTLKDTKDVKLKNGAQCLMYNDFDEANALAKTLIRFQGMAD